MDTPNNDMTPNTDAPAEGNQEETTGTEGEAATE